MTDTIPTASTKVDAVTVEIVRRGLIAVTEEMKTNLMRTAYNLIIYEALDFTVGLFTKEGETVSIGLGLPMFIRGMSETVKAKIRHFGYENSMHPVSAAALVTRRSLASVELSRLPVRLR
jgi:N-methylhydantoinase B